MLRRIQQIGIACALKKLKHAIFMDAETRNLCALNGAYEYLQRYKKALQTDITEYKAEPTEKIIWTCWLQGIENAPVLVKKCIESMRQYANGYKVEVIDLNNVSQFVQLPDLVVSKYKAGIIPHAHFSDMIRLALLEKYGGVWIDSTILMTDVLPDYILDANLFAFRGSGIGHVRIYNPFLAAKPHHPIIQSMLLLLYAYWKEKNKLVSYSIFHLFFSIAIEQSHLNQSLWNDVPNVSGTQMFYLQSQLGRPFDSNVYELATRLSSLHKLTYKFDEFGIDISKKGTFYDVLI
jgi:mannosyltransferase OCH1-like enzyme